MGMVPRVGEITVSAPRRRPHSPTLALLFVSALSLTAQQTFAAVFGTAPTLGALAPGRVNLIGEHTDYNAGFVLPMALDRATVIVGQPNGTSAARLFAPAFSAFVEIPLDQLLTPSTDGWVNYVRGVIAGFQARGAIIPGFDAVIVSDVPMGGGLSSSAALEVSTAMFLQSLTSHEISPDEMALLCQQAEHSFAGVPCGVMDQFISRCAQSGHAMLLDCASLETTHIPFADDSVSLLIINSMVKHSLAESAYANRRQTCEAIAAQLQVAALRWATLATLAAANLDDESTRRARHVISEIARTQQAAVCLATGDWSTLGQLMRQSHASLRDDYEVSCPELDWLVAQSARIPSAAAVYGARMTGGGFGGCMILLVESVHVSDVQIEMVQAYQAHTGHDAESLISLPAAGTRSFSLTQDAS